MNRDYEYICAIVEEKSFTLAARKLFTSQPALSATVHRIESQIGYKIFDRSVRELRLTEEGEAYVAAAKKILDIEKNLQSTIDDLHTLDTGHLYLAGTSLFSSCVIPQIVNVYTTLYPKIALDFIEADSFTLYNEALKNNVDIIVDGGAYDIEEFCSKTLFKEHVLLAVPRDFAVIHNRHLQDHAISLEDIKSGKFLEPGMPEVDLSLFRDEKFVLLKSRHDISQRAYGLCEEAGFVPKCSIELNQLLTAYSAASCGLGITFVTDTAIKNSMVSPRLAFYRIHAEDQSLLSRSVFLAWRKGARITLAMKKFIDAAEHVHIT